MMTLYRVLTPIQDPHSPPGPSRGRYWGVWAAAAEQVSVYWQAQEQSTMTHYLQGLREQGKI